MNQSMKIFIPLTQVFVLALLFLLAIFSSSASALGSLTISPTTVSESNYSASNESAALNIVLSTTATADVTINFVTDSQCLIENSFGAPSSSSTLIVLTGNSSIGTTLTAVNDEVVEGTHVCSISFITSSADSEFNGINKIYKATVNDNDGLPSLSIVVTEDNHIREGNLSFRNVYSIIRGQEEPTAPITLTVWTDSQCALRKQTLDGYTSQITQQIYDYAVPIIVVANDDEDVEGTHTCHIQHSISTTDPAYAGNSIDSRYVTVDDNESGAPGSSNETSATSGETPVTENLEEDASQGYVGKYGGEPIRLTDPDAAANLFIIMTTSAVVVGSIMGWWRYGRLNWK